MICPITYEPVIQGEKYSSKGLKLLSKKLLFLNDLEYTAEEQQQLGYDYADKLSIQGVQPKLSMKLNAKESKFEMAEQGGKFILKPQNALYSQLPENEDLTMRLAKALGIEVPLHGMVYSVDGSLTYFIKRFDREGHNKKIAVEDFSQLSGMTREKKYNFSMERLIPIIEKYCSFPIIAKRNLLVRVLFNYIIGNEDMHLKNFSLISRNGKVELAPAYDFVNSTIVLKGQIEEIALPINGKKHNLTRNDFVDHYAQGRLQLRLDTIDKLLEKIHFCRGTWEALIAKSFLSDEKKDKYRELVNQRMKKLAL